MWRLWHAESGTMEGGGIGQHGRGKRGSLSTELHSASARFNVVVISRNVDLDLASLTF